MYKREGFMILLMCLKVFEKIAHTFIIKTKGIGYIEKLSKNKIRWVGQNEENNYKEEINELSGKMKDLESEEKKIDDHIQKVTITALTNAIRFKG